MSVRLRKRIAYSNSFQSFLTAKLRADGDGTAIEAELSVHPFTRTFVPIWFGGVIFVCAAFITVSLIRLFTHHRAPAEKDEWLGVVIPPGMLIFGYFLVWFCRYLARDEARFLIDFLRKELDAVPR